MAAGVLSKPGTEFGPCAGNCNHTDCEQTKVMAQTGCKYCHQPIGYDRRFFRFEGHQLAHESCAYKEQERLDKAVLP